MSSRNAGSMSPRRSFLGQMAVGAAAVAAGSMLPASAARAGAACRSRPALTTPGSRGTRRSTGWCTMRPELNSGFPLIFALTYINTMTNTYMLKPEDTGVVVVMRHMGIGAALNDAIWQKYKLGEVFKVTDPETKQPALRNIFYKSHEGDLMTTDASGDKLIARGVRVCVCNVALTVLSGKVGGGMGSRRRTLEGMDGRSDSRRVRRAERRAGSGAFAGGRGHVLLRRLVEDRGPIEDDEARGRIEGVDGRCDSGCVRRAERRAGGGTGAGGGGHVLFCGVREDRRTTTEMRNERKAAFSSHFGLRVFGLRSSFTGSSRTSAPRQSPACAATASPSAARPSTER